MQGDREESKPEKPNLTCAGKARSHHSVVGVSIALLQLSVAELNLVCCVLVFLMHARQSPVLLKYFLLK